MEVICEDGKLSIRWTYKITKHTHITKISKITQCIIGLSTTLLNLVKIRKIMFVYKNPLTGKYGITTTEPTVEEYYAVLTRTNGKQVTVQLPKEMGLDSESNQQAIITYYPHEEDPFLKTKPYITLDIVDIEEKESEAEIRKDKNENVYLKWEIAPHKEVPFDLKQFLTEDEINSLNHNTKPMVVEVDVKTLKVNINDADEEKTDS